MSLCQGTEFRSILAPAHESANSASDDEGLPADSEGTVCQLRQP